MITVIGLVALMNIVNFSDGVDGLAAGVSAIIALALAVVAISLYYEGHRLHSLAPAVFAALIAGGCLGFLVHNFPPASSFMGDCGANLLGLLMGVLAVEATVKTEIVISFVLPLILLTVPFLDTTFVVLKRLNTGARSTLPTASTSITAWPASASLRGARSPTCTSGR